MTHANLEEGAEAPLARIAHYPVTFFAIGMGFMGLTFGYAEAAASATHRIIGAGLFMLLLMVVVGLILRTALAIRRGTICVPE